MSQHTPGPWQVHLDGPFVLGGDCIPVEAMTEKGMVSREICTLMVDTDDFPNGKEWKEDAANARLIAAAPDLLEACEAALPLLAQPVWFPRSDAECAQAEADIARVFALVSAAVARAKGECG